MSLRSFAFQLIFFLTCLKTTTAQNLSMQINAGLMNYGGDLQSQVYTFTEAQLSAGLNLKYSIGNFGLRAGFNYGKIEGDDSKGKYPLRNLSFKSTVIEANGCLEYDFDNAAKDRKLIPYLFAGLALFHYNPYTNYNGQKVYLQPLGTEGEGLTIYPKKKMYALTAPAIPMGVGVRYKLSSNLLLGLEFNSRYLFTDYLDDVSRSYPKENELYKQRGQLAVDLSFRSDEIDPALTFPDAGKMRGNPKQNDNYYTSSLTLTYIFSAHSLFQGTAGKGSKRSLDCPKDVY